LKVEGGLLPGFGHITMGSQLIKICDDTSKFACTGDPLKIKDKTARITHEDVRANK
jgi:hypothetical protein